MSKNRGPQNDERFAKLLELEYGLLDDEEASEWRARIASEPALARIHAEVVRSRQSIAEASRVSDEPIEFAPPKAVSAQGVGPRRWLDAVLAMAASLLVGLVGLEIARPAPTAEDAAARAVVMDFAGPAEFGADAPNVVDIQTTQAGSGPVSQEVRVELRSTDGALVESKQVRTDQRGSAQVIMPPSRAAAGYQLIASTPNAPPVVAPVPWRGNATTTRWATDRPVYRPTDQLYFRSLTLDRVHLRPVDAGPTNIAVRSANFGPAVTSLSAETAGPGVRSGTWSIPADIEPGNYRLEPTATDESSRVLGKTSIEIRRFDSPVFLYSLEFDKRSYTAGNQVESTLRVEGRDGAPLDELNVHVRVADGNQTYLDATPAANDPSAITWSATLPNEFGPEPIMTSIEVSQGDRRQLIEREIPVTRDALDLEFFPESGRLIADLPTRIYISARDADDRRPSLEGEIVDANDHVVATFDTGADGLGVFEMTPTLDETYQARITSTDALRALRPFPTVVAGDATLRCRDSVLDANEPLTAEILATKVGIPLVVSATCRGVPAGVALVTTSGPATPVRLDLPASTEGVIRVTVFDRRHRPLRPIAERLAFRRPAGALKVEVASVQPVGSEDGEWQADITVRDQTGRPTPCVLGISIVDQSFLDLGREPLGSQSADFLLLGEIDRPQDIEDAAILLQESESAETALDRTLATHGWRTFRPAMLQNVIADDIEPVVAPVVVDNRTALPEWSRQRAESSRQGRRTNIVVLGTAAVWLFAVLLFRQIAVLRTYWVWLAGVLAVPLILFGGFWFGMEDRGSVREVMPSPQQESSKLAIASPSPVDDLAQSKEKEAEGGFGGGGGFAGPAAQGGLGGGGFREGDERLMMRKRQVAVEAPPAEPSIATEESVADQDTLSRRNIAGLTLPAPVEKDHEELPPAPAAPPADSPPADAARPLEAAVAADKPAGPERADFAEESAALGREEPQRLAGPMTPFVREYRLPERPLSTNDLPPLATVYWNPYLVTDPNGQARIRFSLAQEPATYVVRVDAHDPKGRLGSARQTFVSKSRNEVDAKGPAIR